ncbi:MAG: hydroxyacid dehydrogenase [Candidatus Dependentiae bacterium]|nr:hydroxyacid dehydrogenase [Candidatus Dependentiae bacterium]
MKIAFFEMRDCEVAYVQRHLTGFEPVFFSSPISPEQLPPPDTEILCPFVGSKIDDAVLGHCPHLRLIATRSTGFDHIDRAACRTRGITVVNVPRYGESTVAEFTFGLLLTLTRKLYDGIRRVKEEGRFCCEGLQGTDLKGKTIGVVGTGSIGTHVAKIAGAFGMTVVAYDTHQKQDLIERYGVRYLPLDELLRTADIITLHVPYLPATHHLINRTNLATVKKGALLVNTARGAIVETEGLVWALQQGVLGGAALDVLEEEGCIVSEVETLLARHPREAELRTMLADHALMRMSNVVITPHNAFNSIEAIERIVGTTLENIKAFVAGSPVNVVK